MRNSGIPLDSLPPKVRAQVVAQLATKSLQSDERKRLRQSSKGPNKTEAAFAAHVRACYPGKEILEQAVTLVLANGLRYTPDIFLPSGRNGAPKPAFYEVKGFMRDDAAAKIKVAARVHRWADFFLVTRRGRTCAGWDIQVILP